MQYHHEPTEKERSVAFLARSLSFEGVSFRIANGLSYTETEIHIAPDIKNDLAIFRFSQKGRFVEEHKVKLTQLKVLRF